MKDICCREQHTDRQCCKGRDIEVSQKGWLPPSFCDSLCLCVFCQQGFCKVSGLLPLSAHNTTYREISMAVNCLVMGEAVSLSTSMVTRPHRGPSPVVTQSCFVHKPLHPKNGKSVVRSHLVANLFRKAFLSGSSLISPKGLSLRPSYDPLHKRKFHVHAEAYEAGKSDVLPEGTPVAAVESKDVSAETTARRVKIGIYFATWWALNVVFNIYNKKVLNAFPYPWLTSTLSLAAGSLIMLASWLIRIVQTPDVDLDFWKTLAPVALAHTIGHVAATVSMSKVAVSFTHIIKSAEPAFSVVVSRFLLGEHFPIPVYLSLIPIIGGCGLAALTELNFNMTGFMGAMISNLAFVFRNIFSKRGMKGKSVGGINYYACLSMLSLVFLTPFAFAVEGPKLWVDGWQAAVQAIGPHFAWWVVAQSVFYHLYNQVSYMSLDEISPLTFSIGNTMKRVSVIVSSIIIFHTAIRPINAVGAAVAIFGTFLYSQAKQ